MRRQLRGSIRLGILDIGHPAWTVVVAPEVDRLGYSRYWLGEHHGSPTQSGSPEVLVGIVAALTRGLRVGAAGVLLPLYSPLKVAESFRILQELFPDRIDLGISRGFSGQRAEVEPHEEKVAELIARVRNPDERALTTTEPPPMPWILGHSARSAALAAKQGAAFAFSELLASKTPVPLDGPAIVRSYRDNFQPSEQLPEPSWTVCVAGACTEGAVEGLFSEELGSSAVVGDPETCARALRAHADRFECDEMIFLDACDRLADKRRSYALLAGALGLGDAK